MAGPAVFLAGGASQFINGQVIVVDGVSSHFLIAFLDETKI
jgi:hypothetical protein